jgi:Rhodopirellula transposase DDE domain
MTEPIFGQLAIVNKQAKDDPTILRLSLDAKATVKVGNFSRGGKTRADVEGNDHYFKPEAKITPYGIFLPELDEIFYYFTTSKVTSDFAESFRSGSPIRDKLRCKYSCQAGLSGWLKEKQPFPTHSFWEGVNNQFLEWFANRFNNSQIFIFRSGKIFNGVSS